MSIIYRTAFKQLTKTRHAFVQIECQIWPEFESIRNLTHKPHRNVWKLLDGSSDALSRSTATTTKTHKYNSKWIAFAYQSDSEQVMATHESEYKCRVPAVRGGGDDGGGMNEKSKLDGKGCQLPAHFANHLTTI